MATTITHYQPIAIPADFWHRPAVQDALRDRDITALFGLLRKWVGASQYRIGVTTGLSQGRVSRIMNGQQRVTAFDLLERIAQGLAMSDQARHILGLAPLTTPPERTRGSDNVAVGSGTAELDDDTQPRTDVGLAVDQRAQARRQVASPEWELRHQPSSSHEPALAAVPVEDLLTQAEHARRGLDRTLAGGITITAAQVGDHEDNADESARLCVFMPPYEMVRRLLLDVGEIQDLIRGNSRPPLQQGLYRVAAKLSVLVADELMVLGEVRQSRFWHATARFAADQADDAVLRSHTRALGALLALYYGTPDEAVALTERAMEIGTARSGPHRALASTYRALALAQASAVEQSLHALDVARAEFADLSDAPRQDTVLGFSERRFRFYEGRILSYLGRVDEAWSIHEEALARYPADVVGDPALIYFDRAISLIRTGQLEPGIELAERTLTELTAQHRADLFVRAAGRVVNAVAASDKDEPHARALRELVRRGGRHDSPLLPRLRDRRASYLDSER